MVGARGVVVRCTLAVVGTVVSCGGQSFEDGSEAGSGNRSPQASDGVTSGRDAGRLATGNGGLGSGGSSSRVGSGGFTAGSGGSSSPAGSGGDDWAGCGASRSGDRVRCPAPSGCDSVVCQEPGLCDAGFSVQRKPGACCPSCAPNDDQSVACVGLPCPEHLDCPLGYVAGGGDNGGCCYECVPDRLFCMTRADCVEATEWEATSCCACPQIISLRLYEEDSCWYGGPDGRRPQLMACGRNCDVGLACPCPFPGEPHCQDNRCVGAFVPPPN